MDGLKKDKKVMPHMLYARYRQFRMIEAQSENYLGHLVPPDSYWLMSEH